MMGSFSAVVQSVKRDNKTARITMKESIEDGTLQPAWWYYVHACHIQDFRVDKTQGSRPRLQNGTSKTLRLDITGPK
jgi:hypothetical protein